MTRKILCWLVPLLFFTPVLKGQSQMDLRINEILVLNDSGYIDDFGQHSPWIEIFNSAYNYVNIGGCYLTNDINQPTRYLISKGDPLTLISPRNYLVFWADNKPTHGIRHLNFDLRKSHFLALFASNGRTLIDSITLGPQVTGISFGRGNDGMADWGFLPKNTPNANNNIDVGDTGAQQFQKIDPIGIGLAAIAMSVVFLVLMMLFLVFKKFSSIFIIKDRKIEEKKQSALRNAQLPSDEESVVIALALQLYIKELQDTEDMILTIKKVSRTYSPWSSKIYGVGAWPKN